MLIKIKDIHESDVWSQSKSVIKNKEFETDEMFSNVAIDGYSMAHGHLVDRKLHMTVFGTNDDIMFSAIQYDVV